MSAGDRLNNPGDFLSANFPGFQGGSVTSGPYASFDTMSNGVRAIAVDVNTAIGNGYNTLASFVNHYLGTSNLQPNSQNANPAGYLATLEKATGLGPNDRLSGANVPGVVAGIIQGEGSHVSQSDFQSGLSAAGFSTTQGVNMTANQDAVGSLYSNFMAGVNAFATQPGAAFSYLGGQFTAGAAATAQNPLAAAQYLTGNFSKGLTATTAAAGDTATQAANASGIPALANAVTGFLSLSTLHRGVIILLGFVLLAAAIFALSNNKLPTTVNLSVPALPPVPV